VSVYPFIEAEKQGSRNVKRACELLKVSRAAYYAARSGPSQRCRQDADLTARITVVHEESKGRYGAPRVHAVLRRDGHDHGRKRVARLMRQAGLAGRAPRRWRKTTIPDPAAAARADRIRRDFTTDASKLNARWCGDITYISTWEGWLYLATVIDIASRRVVGFAIADHLRTELIADALANAVAARDPGPGVIFHSDRGCQGGFNWSSQHLVIMEVLGGKTTRGDDRAQCGARRATTAVGCGSGVAASDAITGPAGALACGAAGVLAADRFGCDDGRGRGGHRCVVAGRGAVVPARWRNAADQSGRARGALLVVR
jgi:hypothetical protein